ncbi:hypothetical protein RI129_000167 [Pyrocoelia pectoralis]|uniref:GPN-loop GTPase 2 n=1 Tax=Pyrocoelia pectoralis TaxID=417401 RepID=A0AAN7Z5G8_9COLE
MGYKPAVDIMELVSLSDVMIDLNLGPNGALMYCTEYLEENYDCYFIFDMPGQVELYTHHGALRTYSVSYKTSDIIFVLYTMVDSHYCSDPTKFISTLLLSLSTMLQIGLPHVNVLSKVDYSLVGFIPMDVRSERSLLAVKNAVDKERSMQALLSCAVGARTENERVDTDYV